MSSETDTDTDPGPNPDSNMVFVAIRKAESLSDFDDLADPESVASQIARGRGGGTLSTENTDEQTDEHTPPEGYLMELEEGKIQTKTGYMMRFVKEEHLDLPLYDVLTIPDLRDYRLPESAYESLPPQIRGYLEQDGAVKVRAGYDHENSAFFGAQLGWNYDPSEDIDVWDRLAELITVLGSEQAAIDYLFIEQGPDRFNRERMAEIRGVTTRAIEENLRVTRAELNE